MSEGDGRGSLQERRFAANQTVFRRSNERLSRRLGPSAPNLVPYVCECGDDSCSDLILLPSAEYDHVRSNSAWLLIALDHAILSGGSERIAETHERYQVAEKSGTAGELAVALDTRASSSAHAAGNG